MWPARDAILIKFWIEALIYLMCWSIFPCGYSCAGTKMTSTGIAYSLLGISYIDAQHINKPVTVPMLGRLHCCRWLSFSKKSHGGTWRQREAQYEPAIASFSQVKQLCGSCVMGSDRQSHVLNKLWLGCFSARERADLPSEKER